jgi:hypothetical protein
VEQGLQVGDHDVLTEQRNAGGARTGFNVAA